jgi:hypothetical protein
MIKLGVGIRCSGVWFPEPDAKKGLVAAIAFLEHPEWFTMERRNLPWARYEDIPVGLAAAKVAKHPEISVWINFPEKKRGCFRICRYDFGYLLTMAENYNRKRQVEKEVATHFGLEEFPEYYNLTMCLYPEEAMSYSGYLRFPLDQFLFILNNAGLEIPNEAINLLLVQRSLDLVYPGISLALRLTKWSHKQPLDREGGDLLGKRVMSDDTVFGIALPAYVDLQLTPHGNKNIDQTLQIPKIFRKIVDGVCNNWNIDVLWQTKPLDLAFRSLEEGVDFTSSFPSRP